MNRLIILLAVIATISCKSQTKIKRDVYVGWQLGSSINEVNDKGIELIKAGRINVFKPGVNYISEEALGKYYYSSPVFIFHDTILSQIKVVFLPQLEEIEKDMNLVKQGRTNLNFQSIYADQINPVLVRDVVIKEMNSKYSEYDSRDTSSAEYNFALETIRWNNRNDVDITLSYKQDIISQYPSTSIILTYAYTPSMEKQIFKNKSIY